jgi:hypothetical protein
MVRHALEVFYETEGLPAGGTDGARLDWARAFGLPVPIPNVPARLAVLPWHDVHHLMTGYRTDEAGEGEVAAWTLATGGGPALGRFYDLGAFLVGLVRFPTRTRAAFYRGRQGRNAYGRSLDELLAADPDALRAEAGPIDARPAPRDRLALAGFTAMAALIWGLPLAPVAALGTLARTVR